MSLEFIDCPKCSKRVRSDAVTCHRCGNRINVTEGAEAATGGYSEDDDFEYDEYLKEEFGTNVKPRSIKPIYFVVAWLLILAFLLPYILYLVQILQQ